MLKPTVVTLSCVAIFAAALTAALAVPAGAQAVATATANLALDATATAVIHAAETAHMSLLAAFVTPTPAAPDLRNAAFLRDTSLIDNEPCAAPCWRNIVAGVTDWDEAIALLQDDASIGDIELQINDTSGGFAATFQGVDGMPCCLMYSHDGRNVDQMLLQFAPANTLGDVIENLGEPAYFSGSEVSREQAAAALFYPDLNLIIYAFVEGTQSGLVRAESEVFAALYLSDFDMRAVVESSNLIAWSGYNSYRGYLSQPFAVTAVATPSD